MRVCTTCWSALLWEYSPGPCIATFIWDWRGGGCLVDKGTGCNSGSKGAPYSSGQVSLMVALINLYKSVCGT